MTTYTYKTIDPAGTIYTFLQSINASGQIVGYYSDGGTIHGFIDNAGVYTVIDPPHSAATQGQSINDSGQIVGYYRDFSGHQHGFLDNAGTYTTIDVPGSTDTFAQTINASGQIVGYYNDSSGHQDGFLYSFGTYTTIDVPGSRDNFAQTINASEQIVGYYYDSSGHQHGFLYSSGTYTTIDIGNIETAALNINDSGEIVGYYKDSSGHEHGFLDNAGTYTTIDPPGSIGTFPQSINASGQIVGYYNDSSGHQHGFLDNAGVYTIINPPGHDTVVEDINASGQIVGAYYDSSNQVHGFIATPPPDATWLSNPASGDWNSGSNWSAGSVPTGTATFGASNVTTLTISDNASSIQAIQFTVGAPAYSFVGGISITGDGIINNSLYSPHFNNNGNFEFFNASTAGNATITGGGGLQFLNTSTAGNASIAYAGTIQFLDASTAGNASITSNYVLQFLDASSSGSASITNNSIIDFRGGSTAGNASITNNDIVEFSGTSTADIAIITNNSPLFSGGALQLLGNSNGGQAQFINNAGGIIDFSGTTGANNDGRLSAGSIDGAGNYYLGSNQLTVGSNNLSTTVSGVISDGGQGSVSTNTGGSLVKIGTGTLTLLGTDTYTGATTVNSGILSVNGSIASSSGVTVNTGGTLEGTGTVAATTINSGGTLEPGDSIGTITISGNLVLNSSAFYLDQVSPTAASETTITGTASIAGTFTADAFTSGYSGTHTYTVLHSAGLLSGAFSSLTTMGNFDGANVSLSYDAHDAFLTVTMPTQPPTISITTPIAGDNVINKAEAASGVAISGTESGADGQTVTVKILSGSTVVDSYTATAASGAWTVNVTTAQAQALADGSYSVTADVSDQYGNAAKEATQAITVHETAAPIVTSIMASPSAGELTAGNSVTIALNVSEAVNVAGAPTLQLNDNEVATYSGGSGTSTLTFTYTVQPGDNTTDLKVTALNLPSGASIHDTAGNNLSGSVTADLGIGINDFTAGQIQAEDFAITRTTLPLEQVTSIANAINSGAQTEAQLINNLLSQVADTTIPAVAVEASMYGAVGASNEVTLLATQFLPAQVANAIQNGLNPQVYACEVLGLVFAFGDESGGMAFATNFGPSNAAMPSTTAGDAAFAAAAASAIFGSAATANTPGAIQGFVSNWEAFYTSSGIPGIASPTAAQIDLAARGAAWGDAVGVALANNLGPLNAQAINFLEDAAQGTAIYLASLSSEPSHAPFQGAATAAVASAAGAVQLTGVAAHIDHGGS